ncbi:RNA polymerase sigma factor [Rhodohalobacter sp. 614A]|uniref:RNA polymerase sigma factor n=1 Tax=Rhodohalobacter sp. 614A TaxID=2908649 RepID=UPI001F48A917|nr:sigma-70 family RNA polymerase sigma factor [Rhodohalobacter sp. 614A]
MTQKEFEHLYDSYVTSVARFLSHYTKKTDQLEDWVQIVFFKLWKYRESVDVDGEYLKTYLLKIARNVALTQLSKEKQEIVEYKADMNEIPKSEEVEEWYTHAGEEQKPGIFMEKYNDVFDKIPPRAQEVYQLSREEGLTYQEIAETLQISPKTVEVHISKALHVLRKELEEFQG